MIRELKNKPYEERWREKKKRLRRSMIALFKYIKGCHMEKGHIFLNSL